MFPGARDGPLSQAAYALVGAPLDCSSTFYPGARFGPERIRHFSRGFEDFDHRTGQHFSELGVIDLGDIRAWDDAPEYLAFLRGELRDVVNAGAVPIVLGGEHTVTVAGVEATDPSVFVALDAHLDMRESFDGNPYSHATVTHHSLETVEEAIVLGARAGNEDEWERARRNQSVTAIDPGSVGGWIENQIADAIADRSVYLSIDMDVIDPGFAPATGTKEPIGLTPQLARDAIRSIAPSAIGFDVVEVTDRDDGQTPTLAAKLLREAVYTHANNQ